MSCIHTFSNNLIDPCSPKKEQIFIEDIAHALSLICRAGGHFSQFYSVAQHCIACAGEAEKRGYSKKLQLFCLLHDASEAYIADITRPVSLMSRIRTRLFCFAALICCVILAPNTKVCVVRLPCI